MSLPVFHPALLGTHHDLMSFSFFLRLVSLQLPSTFPCALFTSAYCAEGWAKCHDYMGSSCLAWHSLSKPCQTWRQPGSLGTIFTERSVRYDAPSLFLWRRRNSRDPIPSLPRILKSVPVFLISCTMCKVQSFFFFLFLFVDFLLSRRFCECSLLNTQLLKTLSLDGDGVFSLDGVCFRLIIWITGPKLLCRIPCISHANFPGSVQVLTHSPLGVFLYPLSSFGQFSHCIFF